MYSSAVTSIPSTSLHSIWVPPQYQHQAEARHKQQGIRARALSSKGNPSPSYGLRTPPSDDMATTYHPQNVMAYDSRATGASYSGYPADFPQHDRRQSSRPEVQPSTNYARYVPPTQGQQARLQNPSQVTTQVRPMPIQAAQAQPASQPSHLSSSGGDTIQTNAALPDTWNPCYDAEMVRHSMDIPRFISPNGGNMAHFAAQITCFFWFETSQVLQTAEKVELLSPAKRIPALHKPAKPHDAFQRWVHSVLSTTQVTQNVVLLALLFIYRLKTTNPQVKGREGSEYRLLTVALMLGNKFLDDNTYTNKTWAEVSGISVQEIHVMEVEFLSNMRYSLLVSRSQWEDWFSKLIKFWKYCERAVMAASPLSLSPPALAFASPIPSPTLQIPSTTLHRPDMRSAYSPASATSVSNASSWSTYQNSMAPLANANRADMRSASGKRVLSEEDLVEPPAKRMVRPQPAATPCNTYLPPGSETQSSSGRPSAIEPRRLPVPHLTLITNNSQSQGAARVTPSYSSNTPLSSQPQTCSLPPLVPPGVRAMSTVFPHTPSSIGPAAPQLPTIATSHAPMSAAPLSSGTMTPTGHVGASFGTPSKRLSPVSSLTPATAAYASSPLTEGFPHMGVHTPLSQSPSVYLQHRASPYKPVRHFHTLLVPPPSASLQEYHLSGNVVPPNQMHYQPLGRRHEYRTGIVPEFQQNMTYVGHPQPGMSMSMGMGMTSAQSINNNLPPNHPHPLHTLQSSY